MWLYIIGSFSLLFIPIYLINNFCVFLCYNDVLVCCQRAPWCLYAFFQGNLISQEWQEVTPFMVKLTAVRDHRDEYSHGLGNIQQVWHEEVKFSSTMEYRFINDSHWEGGWSQAGDQLHAQRLAWERASDSYASTGTRTYHSEVDESRTVWTIVCKLNGV